MNQPSTAVTEYILKFPLKVQEKLNQMRETIRANAPEAIESMAYGMPAYKTNKKPLVYFAGYKNHIGFYATPNGHVAFAAELAQFKGGKGSVQFPLTQPLPLQLVADIVQFKLKENAKK